MGDVWLIAGCLCGCGVIYAIILDIFAVKAEATPRPDLKEERKE